MKRLALLTLSFLTVCLAPLASAVDKVHLKDGRVIEGEITREGDDYLYITYYIGELERTEFVLRVNIDRVENDDKVAQEKSPAKPAPARPAAEPTRTAARPSTKAPSSTELAPGTRKIAFITLEEMVGPFMNADALSKSVDLLEESDPDIVVLQINSGGGALLEVEKLSDVIEKEIKPKYRVVAWIQSAISAAAMTAVTCEEIYMMDVGNIGAATAFNSSTGRAVAVKGEFLEQILRGMEKISQRGNHNPLVMRAMQVPTDLSADIDDAGRVTWRNDLGGQYVVSTKSQILTFNSVDAVRFGLARAVANNKNDLARALGCSEWIEVGHKADEYQQQFRNNVQTAQVRASELYTKMNIALQANNIGRARSFLGQLRGWVRRAPSLETYGAGGLPPLTEEFFRNIDEQIDEIARKQNRRR